MSSDAFLDANGTRAQYVTTGGDVATYYIRRDANHSGGSSSWVSSGLRIDSFIRNANATNIEWALTGVMNSWSNFGENVAGYLQGNKYGLGPVWGAVIEVQDFTGANPTSGAVALEVDVDGNGTDNNLARIGIDVAIRRPPSSPGASMEASFGLRFQNSGDASTFLKTAIGTVPGMAIGIGLDLSGAAITGQAIKLAQNQVLQFSQTGGSATARQMYYNGNGFLLAAPGGPTFWAFNDNGSLVASGTQLLGTRQTITGSRATDAWRQSLMAALAAHGLATDITTA